MKVELSIDKRGYFCYLKFFPKKEQVFQYKKTFRWGCFEDICPDICKNLKPGQTRQLEWKKLKYGYGLVLRKRTTANRHT